MDKMTRIGLILLALTLNIGFAYGKKPAPGSHIVTFPVKGPVETMVEMSSGSSDVSYLQGRDSGLRASIIIITDIDKKQRTVCENSYSFYRLEPAEEYSVNDPDSFYRSLRDTLAAGSKIHTIYFDTNNTIPQVVITTNTDGNITGFYDHIYDGNFSLARIIGYDFDIYRATTLSRYNRNGWLTGKIYRADESQTLLEFYYTYKKDNLIGSVGYTSSELYNQIYYENNRIKTAIVYSTSDDDADASRTEFYYDGIGADFTARVDAGSSDYIYEIEYRGGLMVSNKVRSEIFDLHQTYRYNEHDDIIAIRNEGEGTEFRYEYQYDSYGNWIRRDVYSGGEPDSRQYRTIKYRKRK